MTPTTQQASAEGPRTARVAPAWIALCCAWPLIANLDLLVKAPRTILGTDFLADWVGGRLFLAGKDPYSLTLLESAENAQGWLNPNPLPIHYPPWAMPILGLTGAFPLVAAHLLWLAISIALCAWSAVMLWDYFGGAPHQRWIALAVLLTFIPFGAVTFLGQITPLLLASVVAFLLLVEKQRWFLAGLVLNGLGGKPHLLWLFVIAVLLWSLQQRRFRLLSGALTGWALLWIGAVLYDPAAGNFFRDAYGPTMTISAGAGGYLREIFGMRHAWLQYLPSLLGALWMVWYWLRHGRNWSWREHLPLLLIVSVASSPYCWFHDFILTVPAFVALAARGRWRSVTTLEAWAVVQVVILLGGKNPAREALLSALWLVVWWVGAKDERRGAAEPAHS